MTDFDYEIDEAFVREARLGLTVVAVLLGIFFCVAWVKYNGWPASVPELPEMAGTNEPVLPATRPVIAESTLSAGTGLAGRSDIPPGGESTGDAESSSAAAIPKPRDPVALSGSGANRPVDLAETPVPDLRPPDRLSWDGQGSNLPPRRPDETARQTPFQRPDFSPNRQPAFEALAVEARGIKDRPGGAPSAEPRFWASIFSVAGGAAAEPVGRPMPAGVLADIQPQPNNPFRQTPARQPDMARRLETAIARSEGNVRPASGFPATGREPVAAAEAALDAEHRKAVGGGGTANQPTSVVSQELDSFWLIAQRVYGDGRYFNALYEFNRDQVESFNDIPAGTRISTPPVDQLRQRWPDLCPRETFAVTTPVETVNDPDGYTTEPGDTLFEIARNELGQASRYLEILDLNRDRLAPGTGHETALPPGTRIRLPVR